MDIVRDVTLRYWNSEERGGAGNLHLLLLTECTWNEKQLQK
jgi:hypothetical protein